MRIDLFFRGGVFYRLTLKGAAAAFSYCYANGISPKRITRGRKTGEIRFFLARTEARALDAVLQPEEVLERRERGLPLQLRALKARPGLLFGILLAVALLITARLFLWEVEIEGTVLVPSEELERELCEVGIARGAFLPTMDTQGAEIALREGDGRVAYVSINLRGTVAHVQIRESEIPKKTETARPANLVARCDGVVTMPLIFEGECVVAAGEAVRAGQLLASGILDTQNHGYRLTRAAGQVLARTTHTYTVRVPFAYEETVEERRVGNEFSLLFFNSTQKVYKNCRNITDECDIIEKIRWVTLPGGRRLPFGWLQKSYVVRECGVATRTAAQARQLALRQLELQLAADGASRVMLHKTTESRVDAEGLTLYCTVVCEEDIAVAVDIKSLPEEEYGTGNR